MSRFSDAKARMTDRLFEHMSDPASYTPVATGMPIATRAIIHRNVNAVPAGYESEVTLLETHISFPAADIGEAIQGDAAVVNGERFIVQDLAPNGNTDDKIRVVVIDG